MFVLGCFSAPEHRHPQQSEPASDVQLSTQASSFEQVLADEMLALNPHYTMLPNFLSTDIVIDQEAVLFKNLYPQDRSANQGDCSTLSNYAFQTLVARHPQWTVLRTEGKDPNYFNDESTHHVFLLILPYKINLEQAALTDQNQLDKFKQVYGKDVQIFDPSFKFVGSLRFSKYQLSRIFGEQQVVGYSRNLLIGTDSKQIPLWMNGSQLIYIDMLSDAKGALLWKFVSQDSDGHKTDFMSRSPNLEAVAQHLKQASRKDIIPADAQAWTEFVPGHK